MFTGWKRGVGPRQQPRPLKQRSATSRIAGVLLTCSLPRPCHAITPQECRAQSPLAEHAQPRLARYRTGADRKLNPWPNRFCHPQAEGPQQGRPFLSGFARGSRQRSKSQFFPVKRGCTESTDSRRSGPRHLKPVPFSEPVFSCAKVGPVIICRATQCTSTAEAI